MPFARPTLPELIGRTTADLVSRLEISTQVLRRAFVRVLARVWSGAVHELHGHLDWNARQLLASTADAAQLDQHGADIGVARLAGAYASGVYTFTGTNGSVIPAGRRLQRSDGAQFEVEADATVAGGTATASLRAVVAGALGNTEAGVAMTLVSPVAGVQSSGLVATGGLSGGADVEGDEAYRSRILERKRNPPQGGSKADYLRWAKEVPGVTRAWVYPQWMGPGTVGVTFVRDGDVSPIPDAGEVTAVQTYIDDPARRPVTAEAVVFAPAPLSVNFSINVTPDTTTVRSAVQAELTDLLRRIAEPGKVIPLSKLREAISVAAGEDSHDLTAPSADIEPDPNELPVMGAITWL